MKAGVFLLGITGGFMTKTIAISLLLNAPALAQQAIPILDISQVPPPASLSGSWVMSVYSPAVTRWHGELVMTFGVSVYCQNGVVAADSIAVAQTNDNGQTWHFSRYLITPPAEACSQPLGWWPAGFLWEFNDPYIWVEASGVLWMVYTAVEWPQGCGNIGIGLRHFLSASIPE